MTTSINRRLFLGGTAALTVAALSPTAWANGGEFYEVHDDPNQHVELAFSGRVKDTKGKYIRDAEIVINVKEPVLSYSLRTDAMGHYKSTDIGREIKEIGEAVDPSLIQIQVVKEGYKQRFPNSTVAPKGKSGRVPLDFILEATTS